MTTSPQYGSVELISPHLDQSAVVRGGAQDAPIVLLMHGLGSDERDLASLVPFLPPVFEYVSVRGIFRYVQGYAWFDMPLDGGVPQEHQEIMSAASDAPSDSPRPSGLHSFTSHGGIRPWI